MKCTPKISGTAHFALQDPVSILETGQSEPAREGVRGIEVRDLPR